MPNIVSLAATRERLENELKAVLLMALECALDYLEDVRKNEPAAQGSLFWPMNSKSCMMLIIANAVVIRPSLETSLAERRLLLSLLAEVQSTLWARLRTSAASAKHGTEMVSS